MVFIGVGFSVSDMTMFITPERMIELKCLLEEWRTKVTATWHVFQSLTGKLQFVAKCVRPDKLAAESIERLRKFLIRQHETSVGGRLVVSLGCEAKML